MKIVFKMLLIAALLSCKSKGDQPEAEYITPKADTETAAVQQQQQQTESYKRGKEIYNDFCVTCHLANGKGIAGSFPPLDGSDWLTEEKRNQSIHAIKYGLKGPITVNGEEYNSVMVALGLTDQEVADVMNYINNSWSNKSKKPVTKEEVAAIKE